MLPICESESEKRSLGEKDRNDTFRVQDDHLHAGLAAVIRHFAAACCS
jgi:hypothetical protein